MYLMFPPICFTLVPSRFLACRYNVRRRSKSSTMRGQRRHQICSASCSTDAYVLFINAISRMVEHQDVADKPPCDKHKVHHFTSGVMRELVVVDAPHSEAQERRQAVIHAAEVGADQACVFSDCLRHRRGVVSAGTKRRGERAVSLTVIGTGLGDSRCLASASSSANKQSASAEAMAMETHIATNEGAASHYWWAGGGGGGGER